MIRFGLCRKKEKSIKFFIYFSYQNIGKMNINKIVIFCFGGTTYEEARDCYNQNFRIGNMIDSIPIIIGGTFIHNSKS